MTFTSAPVKSSNSTITPTIAKVLNGPTNGEVHAFIKLWRAIERDQRELDFRKSTFSKDLRAKFSAGKAGDNSFRKWCEDHLGLKFNQSEELLARGIAVTIIPDVGTWNEMGGYDAIGKMRDLPKKEQIACVNAAKASNYTLKTVLKQRGHGYTAPTTPITTRKPGKPARSAAEIDVEILAAYVARTCKNMPRHIEKLVSRYLVELRKAAA